MCFIRTYVSIIVRRVANRLKEQREVKQKNETPSHLHVCLVWVFNLHFLRTNSIAVAVNIIMLVNLQCDKCDLDGCGSAFLTLLSLYLANRRS